MRWIWVWAMVAMVSVQASPLLDQAQQLIHHRLPNAHIGFEVRDVKTGQVLLANQPYAAFVPASNLKLLTAAASILGLGKDFRFETSLWLMKNKLKHHTLRGHVWWRFTGDPTFSHKQLVSMVKSLRHLGVRQVDGDIVVDGSRFSGRAYPLGWTEDSLNWAYFAPVTATMVDHNAVRLRMISGARLGDGVKVEPMHLPVPMVFDAQVRTVTQAQADRHCSLWLEADPDNTIHLRGCWPMSSSPKVMHVAVQHPQAWVHTMIKQAFAQQGIVVKGQVRVGRIPAKGVQRVILHQSQPLPYLVKILLKYSDNLMAESLLKTLGHRYYGEGSFAQGVRARESLLAAWAGIDFSKSELYDGSGGSSYNELTPHQLTQLMYVVHHHDNMKPLLSSLPIAGQDGTLQHRMEVFNLAKQVWAKTGSMRHVSSLTGYLTTRTGRILAFSILMDHVLAGTQSARLLQHELCGLFYQIA